MKKKFLAMYALVGAMAASPVFTSCIDDTESASVSAIRNANAEKIKAATAIAQASAEQQAKMDALSLEAKEIENAKAKAELEKLKLEYEKNMLSYQLDINSYKEQLNAYKDGTLSRLTNNYTTALGYVSTYKWNLFNYNTTLAGLEANVLKGQEYYAEEKARLEAEIAANEATVERLKAMNEEGVSEEAIKIKLSELEQAKLKTQYAYDALEKQYGKNAANTAIAKAVAFLANPDGDDNTSDAIEVTTLDAEGYPALVESEIKTARATIAKPAAVTTPFAEYEVAPEVVLPYMLLELGTEADTEKSTYAYDEDPLTKYSTQYAQLVACNKNLEKANELLAKLEKALADAKAALETENAKETPDAAKVAELEGKVQDALSLLKDYKADEAAESSTDYDGNAETKDMGYAHAKNAVEAAENNILKYKKAIQICEIAIAKAEKASEAFEAAIAAFTDENMVAYKTALAELNAAKEAKNLANTEYTALSSVINNLGASSGVFDEYGGEKNITRAINDLENEIANLKDNLKYLTSTVGFNGNYADVNSEEAVAALKAYIEAQIEIAELNLARYEAEAEQAKAALDAYLATDEEGGEAEA